MSIIDPKQLNGSSLLDMVPLETGTGKPCPDLGESFIDYLQKAQTSSADAGEGGITKSGKDPGQPSAPRAHKSDSAAPSLINNSENDSTAADSAGQTDLHESEGRQMENKQRPLAHGKAVSPTEKKKENKAKDDHDGRDSTKASKTQTSQSIVPVNPEAADAKSHPQLGGNTAAIQSETQETPIPSLVAAKGANISSDSGASTKGRSLTENTSQTAGAEEENASASASGASTKRRSLTENTSQTAGAEEENASASAAAKGRASKKSTIGNVENADKLPLEKPADETISDSGENKTSTAEISKYITASSHEVQRITSRQNEKNNASAASDDKAAVSPAATQETTAGTPSSNPAASQTAPNAPVTATKPVEDKIDAKTANSASNNKTADGTNALPRVGPQATNTSAPTSQRNGGETGSQFDRVRFVQRVEQAFAAMGDRGGSVRLKLSPPELGSVRVEITVNKGVMKAHFEAETKEAKNLLLENLPALRDKLAQQNIKIQKFDVDLRDPSSGGMSQQTAGQADTGSREGGYRASQPQTKKNSGAAAITTGTPRLTDHSGQLNVIV